MNTESNHFEHSGIIYDADVIEVLRLHDLSDPETRTIYDKWFTQQEEEADLIGTNLARIHVAVLRAVVYYKSGHTKEAIADLEETKDGALNLNETGDDVARTVKEIETLLQQMKEGGEIL